MLVTVAINTWNRAALLDRTLARMRGLRVPAGVDWELVVVNNNCTDDTDRVVAGHAGRLPIRYVHEPRQGTSHAKNAAVDRAAGDLILWTDDDVLVAPDWMEAYLAAAAAFPDAAIFGGVIRPWYGGRPPGWAARNLDLVGVTWALRDYGPEVRPLGPEEEVFGANMAFRAGALKRYRFDPGLGDVGGVVRKGEEADLVGRMRAAGHRAVWVGTSAVEHYIPAGRLTRRYVWDLWAGVYEASYDPAATAGCRRVGGVPRYLLRMYARDRLVAAVLAPVRTRGWLKAYLGAAKARGCIAAARKLAARPAAPGALVGAREGGP